MITAGCIDAPPILKFMNISFYQNASDKRVITKTLNNEYAITGAQLIDETNITNPVFTVDMNTGLYQYNYVYIPYFNRYYYITEITVLDGSRLAIHCKVDVLMSFSTAIKACTVNSRTNEHNYDMYLPDDRPIESRYVKYSKKFPKSFDDLTPSYILITVGNGQVNLE